LDSKVKAVLIAPRIGTKAAAFTAVLFVIWENDCSDLLVEKFTVGAKYR